MKALLRRIFEFIMFREERVYLWTQKMVGTIYNGKVYTIVSYRNSMREVQSDIRKAIEETKHRRIGVMHQVTRIVQIPRWKKVPKDKKFMFGSYRIEGDLMEDGNV